MTDRVLHAIEDLGVLSHQHQVAHQVFTALVFVALSFVFHILERNGSLDQITVVGGVLLGNLVVEILIVITIRNNLEHIAKNLVQRLVTLLLSLSLAPVITDRVLIIEIIFSEAQALKTSGSGAWFLHFRLLNRLLWPARLFLD
jgi:hypothetical protein